MRPDGTERFEGDRAGRPGPSTSMRDDPLGLRGEGITLHIQNTTNKQTNKQTKVIRVDKTGHGLNYDVTARGKRSIALNLKKEEGTAVLREDVTGMRCTAV